jgi:hypothetical protein
MRKIKWQYGSVPKAKGTELHEEYKKLDKAMKNERTCLRSLALNQIREGFFNTIDTLEIARQLQGLSIEEEFKEILVNRILHLRSEYAWCKIPSGG